MAERAISRKSQLFLNSVLPVVDTHDEVVKKKFKRGKFIFTYAGIVKILSLFFLLISLVLFLSISECDDAPNWYPYLFPVTTGVTFCISLTLFMIFTYGFVIKSPGVWVKIVMDIFLCLILAIITLVSTILSMDACKVVTPLQKVPEPLSITGSILLIIGCAILFLLYRYKDDEDNDPPNIVRREIQAEGIPPRKSVFA